MGRRALGLFYLKIGFKFEVGPFLGPFWDGLGGQNRSSWAPEGLGNAVWRVL